MKFFWLILLSLSATITFSQEEELWVEKYFLIIHSSSDFSSAEEAAFDAESYLGFQYKEKKDCTLDPESGFNCPKDCECGETHDIYHPRGKMDDGIYISIEYSSAYSNFEENLYIVVVTSGTKEKVEAQLEETKALFPDAYIQSSTVYMGCSH